MLTQHKKETQPRQASCRKLLASHRQSQRSPALTVSVAALRVLSSSSHFTFAHWLQERIHGGNFLRKEMRHWSSLRIAL